MPYKGRNYTENKKMDRIREVNMFKTEVSHKSNEASPFSRGDTIMNKHFLLSYSCNSGDKT